MEQVVRKEDMLRVKQKEYDLATAHRFEWVATTEGEYLTTRGVLTYTPDPDATFRGGRAVLIEAIDGWLRL